MSTTMCRGWSHTLRCPEPSVLRLTRADFVTVQCHSLADLVTSFHGDRALRNCSNEVAYKATTSRCNGRTSCTLSDEYLFADTCEWPADRMLRIEISCRKASNRRPSSGNLNHKVLYVWGTSQVNLLGLSETARHQESSPTSTTTESVSRHRNQLTKTLKGVDYSLPTSGGSSGVCSAIIESGVLWPETMSGEVAMHDCPGGARGTATWKCVSIDSNQTDWEKRGPDLTDCSTWTIEIDRKLREVKSIDFLHDAASELLLAVQTLNNNEVGLNAADLHHASAIMTEIVELTEITSAKTAHERGKLMLLSKAMVEAGNILLGDDALVSWAVLNSTMKHKVGSNIMSAIEGSAFHLADEMKSGHARVITEENIVLGVKIQNVEKTAGRNDIVFPFSAPDEIRFRKNVTDSIRISSEDLEKNQENGKTKVVFTWFDNLGQLADDSPHEGAVEHKAVNSRIISATITSRKQKITLQNPVIITLQHIEPTNVSHTCVYWNTDANTSNRWLSDGCEIFSTNSTHTVCACTHLTSFAVLVNHRGFSMEEDEEILDLLTRIGLSASLVCLALSILTFLSFRSLRCARNTVHTNLCVCLFLSQLIFLVGIDLYEHQIVCSVIAGVLHYCLLATFVWMGLEGFQLYVMLVEVFEQSTNIVWYYLTGYGVPAIFVALSAGLNPNGYGTESSCWLKTEFHGSMGTIGGVTPFIWAFVAPASLVAIGNLGFLVLTAVTMYRQGRKYIFYSRIKAIKSSLKSTFALLCLLGTTWILGLLWWWEGMVILQYLFCIFNAFQGVYIFVFHCLLHNKVRYEYRRLFSKCGGENYSGIINSSSTGMKYTATRRRSSQNHFSQKRSSVRKGSVRANYYDGQLKTEAQNLHEASEHFSTQDRTSMRILFARKESLATPYLPAAGSMDNSMIGHHLRSQSMRSCPGKDSSSKRHGPYSKEGPLKRANSERKHYRRRYDAPVSEGVSRILKSAGSSTNGFVGCRYLPAKAWDDGTLVSSTTRSTCTTTSSLPQEGSTLARYHVPRAPPTGPNSPAKQFKLVDKRLAKFKKINSSPSLGGMVRSSSMNSAEKKRREMRKFQLLQPSTSVPDLMSQLSAKIETRDISQVLLMYLDKDGTLNRQKMNEDRRADAVCKD